MTRNSLASESRTGVSSRLRHREQTLNRSIKALESVLSHLPEEIEPSPQIARSVQASENRWRRMAREFPMLDSSQVASLLGISATNRNKASQLAKQGKILGVVRGNRTLYPSFEFDLEAGKVRPVVAEVVKTAGDRWAAESLLQWFCAPNGFLDGRRPVDVIEDEQTLVAAAHKSLAQEW